MSIVRIQKTDNYTVISNTILKDTSITARAKGIYFYLMSLPDDWKLYKKELYKHFGEGEKAIDTAFKELEEKGYIKKEKERGADGRFSGWDYTVLENPTETPKTAHAVNRNPQNRPCGNRGLLNTNEPYTNNINNICVYSEEFEAVWSFWPKKTDKKAAYKKYQSTLNKGVSSQQIEQYAMNYIETVTDNKYCKMLKTFLGPDEPWRDYTESRTNEEYDQFFEGRR